MKSKNTSPESEKTRGGDRRLERQRSALDRFEILPLSSWMQAHYPKEGGDVSSELALEYAEYSARKHQELDSLRLSIKAARRG